MAGIREIADNLSNDNPGIQADCLKVLYEVGYQAPSLIAGYVDELLGLLGSRNNRLVWGSMIALSTIARIKSAEIGQQAELIIAAMKKGSVITVDNGVKTLAIIAGQDPASSRSLFPFLLNHLRTCRPKEVPQHAESILAAVNRKNREDYIAALESRMKSLSPAQTARVRKVIKKAAEMGSSGSPGAQAGSR